ncbi:DUF300-domain-containing protein [Hyaloscypha variabilis F]|uniref:DUF300-domain-containing protein n=1 Tax=Hyaloscypha variabilis (strain UAMH 11265 / GT02V1 / F) TaxID=1149755 RepID=A0A2J6S7D7_HYAVF|nr:DUF300-domain-containing protein [Hyaloscypha variabilis F]
MINTTCNATLDDLRIGRSEVPIAGSLTFHQLGMIIAAACSLFAILISFYLIFMHATHYTKPYEQRHIIRILFMIPVYATASFLSFWFYWHAVYFDVIHECYEAFAIASFFALLCHYIAPNLHDQKNYFRGLEPKGWVWPMTWFKKCCGGERGCWRTPRSGLTWFNIIWAGIYQYCFIRVTMTITAVVTQYFGRYCASSNSPVFAHIWILVIEGAAVSVAMYCVIQFYYQLRFDLAPHRPFLKVAAIKAVIFLSFWQSFLISILTSSTFHVVKTSSKLAYPDIIIGIPALLICIEMAFFSVLHVFAFSWTPYRSGAEVTGYPNSPSGSFNKPGVKQGGFLGVKALVDAMNPWDLVKGFARGMRWLFVGVKTRENDPSYKASSENDLTLESTGGDPNYKKNYAGSPNLPIADEFRRSKFGLPGLDKVEDEQQAGLIAHAQPNPLNPGSGAYIPARQRYDANGQDISQDGTAYGGAYSEEGSPDRLIGSNPTPGAIRRPEQASDIGMAISGSPDPSPYQSHFREAQSVLVPNPTTPTSADLYREQLRQTRRQDPNPSQQWPTSNSNRPSPSQAQPEIHNALWGQPPQQSRQNDF